MVTTGLVEMVGSGSVGSTDTYQPSRHRTLPSHCLTSAFLLSCFSCVGLNRHHTIVLSPDAAITLPDLYRVFKPVSIVRVLYLSRCNKKPPQLPEEVCYRLVVSCFPCFYEYYLMEETNHREKITIRLLVVTSGNIPCAVCLHSI